MIDAWMNQTGEWLKGEGPLSDVVISSRIRLARNLGDYPFRLKASPSDFNEIYRALAEAILSVPVCRQAELIDLEQCDKLDRYVLAERHLISRNMAEYSGRRGVVVSKDERLALMINEEDHLRMQGLRSGLQLKDLWEEMDALDDALSGRVDFAFDKQLGYLTACPTNVGTGIRVSVMLHLPALKMTNEMPRAIQAATDMKLAVRGLYGEGTDAYGDFYQLSNQTTLGVSESEIVREFGQTIIPKFVQYERQARQALIERKLYHLDDRIWRAYGTLCSARIISGDEALLHLSNLRLGVHTGRFDRLDLPALNRLIMPTQPAHLQKAEGRPLNGEERGVVRAEMLRRALEKTSGPESA